jgi:hypothetical protein
MRAVSGAIEHPDAAHGSSIGAALTMSVCRMATAGTAKEIVVFGDSIMVVAVDI